MATDTLVIALAGLAGVTIIAATALIGWHGWLACKARELDLARQGPGAALAGGTIGSIARIELADLKERIRKLEAIAAGVDL